MTAALPLSTAAFDFNLPEELIALRPASPRDASRLLAVDPAGPELLRDRRFSEIGEFLRPGDVLVFNDTKVIPARLRGARLRGGVSAKIELLLVKREAADTWQAMARPAKKLKAGDRIVIEAPGGANSGAALECEVASAAGEGFVGLQFNLSGAALSAAIAVRGEIPLPPYIAGKRLADSADVSDYQTVYAREEGSAAAPTAGLHFTPELLSALRAKGIGQAFVTLHVGAGTFLPVKVELISDHKMHAEQGSVSAVTAEALNRARAAGGRIIAVGTTALRLLESAARESGEIAPLDGETAIFITPGYRFKAVDLLITNFHLPRSTLFMLVSAFSGLDAMKKAYAAAIERGYRFYSYGDASLLHPGAGQ